jgi:predicted outer membrane repeat protein
VVSLDSRTTAVLAGSTLMANNSAANGGALALTTFSTLRLEGACVLEHNTASGLCWLWGL